MSKIHIVFDEIEAKLMVEVHKFVLRAQYKLGGDELLAAAQVLKWVESLQKRAVPYDPVLPPAVPLPIHAVPDIPPAAKTKRARK
jgi:hypothetical protein